MYVIFITAKPRFMPCSEDLGSWTPVPRADGFYMLTKGNYHLFVHECIPETNVRLKVKKKHAIVASWLNVVLSYAKKQWNDMSNENLFVILHDKDLLQYPYTDEGLYREKKIIDAKGGLEGMVKDGNIYLFQHVVAQDMCVALINDLIEPSIENIGRAIDVIKKCTYET